MTQYQDNLVQNSVVGVGYEEAVNRQVRGTIRAYVVVDVDGKQEEEKKKDDGSDVRETKSGNEGGNDSDSDSE